MQHNDVMKLFVIITFLALACSSFKVRQRNENRPFMEYTHYRGKIDEDTVNVILEPPLYARDKDAPQNSGRICDYELIPSPNHTDLPFEAFVLDPSTGQGTIQLKDEESLLDCRNQSKFEFHVVAIDCGVKSSKGDTHGQKRSKRSKVTVKVVDVNDHAPVISNVDSDVRIEGRIREDEVILRLRAEDEDCSDEICRFDIENDEDLPFNISNTGEIYATETIEITHEADEIYTLYITASDCRGRKSEPVQTRIILTPPCHPGWRDVEDTVTILPDHSVVSIVPNKPRFETCLSNDDATEAVVTASLDVSVDDVTCEGNDIVEACDQYDDIMEMLPLHSETPESRPNQIYKFNGKDDVINLEDGDKRRMFLDKADFTTNNLISFSMFLSKPDDEEDQSEAAPAGKKNDDKMTILCKSDAAGHNRHHLSVYVQRCHIMLLLRNEYSSADSSQAQYPAEWHWRLSTSNSDDCYDKWYDVVFNIQHSNVTLQLNGQITDSFLIADDYRLHKSKHAARWSIGAAWQGKEGGFSQFFRGKLSRIFISRGHVVRSKLWKCYHLCQEGIRFQDSSELSVKIVQGAQEAHVSGQVGQLPELLSNLKYLNNLHNMKMLERTVIINTEIRCPDNVVVCPTIAPIALRLEVSPPAPEQVYVMGLMNREVSVEDVKDEVEIFTDIVVKVESKENQDPKLKLCMVKEIDENSTASASGKLRLNSKWLSKHELVLDQTPEEFAISGAATKETYQEGLRTITYQNKYARTGDDLFFSITCYAQGFSTLKTTKLQLSVVENVEPEVEEDPDMTVTQGTEEPKVIVPIDDVVDDDFEDVEFDITTQVSLIDAIEDMENITENYDTLQEVEAARQEVLEELHELPEERRHIVQAVGLVGNTNQVIPQAPVAMAGGHASAPREPGFAADTGDKEEHNTAPLVVTGVCIVLFVTLAIAAIVHTRVRGGIDEENSPLNDDYNTSGVRARDQPMTSTDVDGGMDWDDSAMTITVNPMMEDPDTSDFSDFEEDSDVGGMMPPYQHRADPNGNNDSGDICLMKTAAGNTSSSCNPIQHDDDAADGEPAAAAATSGAPAGAVDDVTREKCMSDDFYEWDA